MHQPRLKLPPKRKPRGWWKRYAQACERRILELQVANERYRKAEAEALARMGVRLAA